MTRSNGALLVGEGSPVATTEGGGPASTAGIPVQIVAVALGLGVLGHVLLRQIPWGLNLPLWIGTLMLALGALARRHSVFLGSGVLTGLTVGFFFAAALAWRASAALGVLNLGAMMVALALAAFASQPRRLWVAGITDYVRWLIHAAIRVGAGAPILLFGEMRLQEVPLPGRAARTAAVLRGLVFALPLMLVFGGLFSAADPVFARFAESLFRWRVEGLVSALFWIVFWSWLASGYLRHVLRRPALHASLLPGRWSAFGVERVGSAAAAGVEVVVILSLLNVLFAAFVLVQFRYLFGGVALVEQTIGLSYAEYARRGFFELTTVAALLLPVLLLLHALLGKDAPRYEGRFRGLACLLVVLLLVILASAAQRMRLYQLEYGLTELRFYTSAFMAWLAVVLVWFVATVLRGQRKYFASGALVSALSVVVLLNIVNPDARIAAANLSNPAPAGRGVDIRYLSRLSADAAPVLVRALPVLPRADACVITMRLVYAGETWAADAGPDWRSWNWSRARADRMRRAAGLTTMEECRREQELQRQADSSAGPHDLRVRP